MGCRNGHTAAMWTRARRRPPLLLLLPAALLLLGAALETAGDLYATLGVSSSASDTVRHAQHCSKALSFPPPLRALHG